MEPLTKDTNTNKIKERHAELVEASRSHRWTNPNDASEMLRQAQHDVLF